MSNGKMTLSVVVVPTDGKAQKKDVAVAKSGASLEEVLKAAGMDTKKKDFLVNGKPAQLNTIVRPKDELKVMERPAGS